MDKIEVGQIRETIFQFTMGALAFRPGDTFTVLSVGRVVGINGQVDDTLIGCELEEYHPDRHNLQCYQNREKVQLCADGHGWWVRTIWVKQNTRPLCNNVVWEV